MKELFRSLAHASARLGALETEGGVLHLRTGPAGVDVRPVTEKEKNDLKEQLHVIGLHLKRIQRLM